MLIDVRAHRVGGCGEPIKKYVQLSSSVRWFVQSATSERLLCNERMERKFCLLSGVIKTF